MARIRYDCYLHDEYDFVTITNTDADIMEAITPESLINPPIRMKFLRTPESSFEQFCYYCFEYHNENNPGFKMSPTDGAKMLHGELPGWRLVGMRFAPEYGFWGYYINEELAAHTNIDEQNNASIMVQFGDDIEVELEVDYADGLPIRRYICKVGDCSNGFATEITEYLGKRKVRKLEYSENEPGEDGKNGWLCHITEY